MEKKLYELEIDEEFRDALPSLSEEQYSSLEESIVSRGCDIPLVVWLPSRWTTMRRRRPSLPMALC